MSTRSTLLSRMAGYRIRFTVSFNSTCTLDALFCYFSFIIFIYSFIDLFIYLFIYLFIIFCIFPSSGSKPSSPSKVSPSAPSLADGKKKKSSSKVDEDKRTSYKER